jgi:hypothetical protein
MWIPLNMKNIFFQNRFIKNMKLGAQYIKTPNPNSLKKQMGHNFP